MKTKWLHQKYSMLVLPINSTLCDLESIVIDMRHIQKEAFSSRKLTAYSTRGQFFTMACFMPVFPSLFLFNPCILNIQNETADLESLSAFGKEILKAVPNMVFQK